MAIEGTGAYGAPLTRHLLEVGEQVAEVGRPARQGGPRGKSDRLDALRAARSVLGDARPAAPRAGRSREALRVLMVARAAQVEARARALTRIRALLVTAPEAVRRALGAHRRRALLAVSHRVV